MNNEPVAWRIKNPQMFNEWVVFPNKEQASLYAFHNGKGNLPEPLYTHPAKTLTDRIAELEKLVSQRFDDGKRLGIIETEDRLLKAKTLTDEEIIAICDEFGVIVADTGLKAIRAILRK